MAKLVKDSDEIIYTNARFEIRSNDSWIPIPTPAGDRSPISKFAKGVQSIRKQGDLIFTTIDNGVIRITDAELQLNEIDLINRMEVSHEPRNRTVNSLESELVSRMIDTELQNLINVNSDSPTRRYAARMMFEPPINDRAEHVIKMSDQPAGLKQVPPQFELVVAVSDYELVDKKEDSFHQDPI